ncbi:hypothetical protein ABKN59_004877 [Abortiporus biennis]
MPAENLLKVFREASADYVFEATGNYHTSTVTAWLTEGTQIYLWFVLRDPVVMFSRLRQIPAAFLNLSNPLGKILKEAAGHRNRVSYNRRSHNSYQQVSSETAL